MANETQAVTKKTFRVWIDQVNQTWVEVTAADEGEAAQKAYRKWRREDAHSQVSHIEEVRKNS